MTLTYSPTPLDSGSILNGLLPTVKTLSHVDKIRLMHFLMTDFVQVVRDLGDAAPGIDSNPDVCGGSPCIVRTRIPVWVLEQARRLGTCEADLLRSYPSLRAEDLTNAWAYVRSHQTEIEQQICENEED